ncbi:hypothetical protein Pelo_19081 [Pelomyxa schiedti]|nr:hypothetical protein Pelo_19081 [Pelomyxa schiedti]
MVTPRALGWLMILITALETATRNNEDAEKRAPTSQGGAENWSSVTPKVSFCHVICTEKRQKGNSNSNKHRPNHCTCVRIVVEPGSDNKYRKKSQ